MRSFTALILLYSFSALAVSLVDYKPYSYEVLFTNPICPEYNYENGIKTNDETLVYSKPKNVYCKNEDLAAQFTRQNSPHKRLVDFITDKNTKELFLAFLSFSNTDIKDHLCSALKRKVKITMVLDSGSEKRSGGQMVADLKKCAGEKTDLLKGYFRGGVQGLGYAHNKIVLVNPSSTEEVKIVFSSGNLSSGTSLHHENWHFLTTNIKSHFAQAHLCVMNGMITAGESIKSFKAFMKICRKSIEAPEEEDIKVFFVPGEGKRAMSFIEKGFLQSSRIDMAAHRFTNKDIMKLMEEATGSQKSVRFVVDDDVYWSGLLGKTVGSNMPFESANVTKVRLAGTQVRYMQTNQKSWLLHHNKFFIFNNTSYGAVFAGAGNFTKAAFTKNFENFYYITIPEVVAAFNDQYTHMWNDLATMYELLPKEMILP